MAQQHQQQQPLQPKAIKSAIIQAQGNVRRAATLLEVSRQTLYYHLGRNAQLSAAMALARSKAPVGANRKWQQRQTIRIAQKHLGRVLTMDKDKVIMAWLDNLQHRTDFPTVVTEGSMTVHAVYDATLLPELEDEAQALGITPRQLVQGIISLELEKGEGNA